MTVQAAISALGTRISFLVLAWLMLANSPQVRDVALVAGAQLLAYVLFRQLAERLPAAPLAADLLSMLALGAIAFYSGNVVVFASLAAVLGALRGFGDRAPALTAVSSNDDRPKREGLARVLMFLAGAGVGAAAMWLGPVGALWANAMVFAVSAILLIVTPTPVVAKDDTAVTGSVVELQSDPLVRRLAVTLFATNLFAQAAAVVLVVTWVRDVTRSPQLLGLIAAMFMLGLLGAGVTFAGLIRGVTRILMLGLGCLVGGAVVFLLADRPPALLLVVAAAFVAGIATASVIPVTSTLLSEHVPAALRSRVDGMLSSVAYVGIPLGTCAAAWFLGRSTVLGGLGVAAGGFLIAMLIPVFAFSTWRQLLPDAPVTLTDQAKLPARLTVTLAYANGQWLVEVRRGRALLGSRHLVKSAEALSMLALLDVPGVQDSVEKALTTDQNEASRQAERMRNELSELEAKLAGLTEMVEITETHRPAPKQRDGNTAEVS